MSLNETNAHIITLTEHQGTNRSRQWKRVSKLEVMSRMDSAMCQVYERKVKLGFRIKTMAIPH